MFVDTTGQTVRKGEPLFRVYSSDIQQALADLLVVSGRGQSGPTLGQSSLNGTMRRLRNLGVPEERIQELRDSGVNSAHHRLAIACVRDHYQQAHH